MQNEPTRPESIAVAQALIVFFYPKAEYGKEFWESILALQTFIKHCRKSCKQKKYLSKEHDDLLERAKNQLDVLFRKRNILEKRGDIWKERLERKV